VGSGSQDLIYKVDFAFCFSKGNGSIRVSS